MKTFDPKQVVITFGGHLLDGFAEGTFVKVERAKPLYETTVGAYGDAVRTKSNDRSGSVMVTLMQTSSSNDALSQMLRLDEDTPGGAPARALQVQDLSGNTLVHAENAWLKGWPTQEWGDSVGSREWTIDTGSLDIHVGGA